MNIPFSQPKCHQLFPPWDHTGQNQIPLTTMSYYISFIGENFENHLSRMAKNAPKLSTIVGEHFEIHLSQMAKNATKLSTMVGENF